MNQSTEIIFAVHEADEGGFRHGRWAARFVWLNLPVLARYIPAMNFRFNLAKATEAACLFLERAAGQINIMKLVKLMYLLDRLSLDRRGVPVAGATTFPCATAR